VLFRLNRLATEVDADLELVQSIAIIKYLNEPPSEAAAELGRAPRRITGKCHPDEKNAPERSKAAHLR
jgi:hypothetical protein